MQIFPNGLTVTTWENLFWNVVRSLIVGCHYDIGENWHEQNISLKMTCRSMQGSIKQKNTFTTMAAANAVVIQLVSYHACGCYGWFYIAAKLSL